MEVVGGLCIVYLLARLDNVFYFSHKLLHGIKFFLPPSNQDIEQLQPMEHKRMKKPPREKSLLEKINLLNLQMAAIRPGLLNKQPLWDVYDFMLFSVMVAVLNHIWCEMYTCISGNLTGHAWPLWVTLFSLILCVHAGVYSTMIVGFQLAEGRYAAGCGIASYMAATIVLYNYADGFKLFAQQLLTFMQHFISTPIGNEQIIVAASVAIGSLVIAGIVGGMFVPAYRWSRLHLELLAAKDTMSARIRLLVDIILPLLAGCSWIFGYLLPIPRWAVQGIQLGLTVLFVCSRVSLFRDHIQQFLLGVRAVIVPELARHTIDGQEIQDRILTRFKYIAIAACEYLAFPFVVVCLVLLLHFNGWLDLGLCNLARSSIGCGGSSAAAEASAEAGVEPETSQTLMDILQEHQDAKSTVAALKVFFKVLNRHTILPPQLLTDVLTITLGMTLTCWFAIYSSCLFYWKYGGKLLSSLVEAVTGQKFTKTD